MGNDRRPAYRALPQIIETRLEHELILLDPRSGQMFSLNETGRFVWDSLPDGDVTRIAERLSERFDVGPDDAEAEVRRLVAELLEAGLVEARHG